MINKNDGPTPLIIEKSGYIKDNHSKRTNVEEDQKKELRITVFNLDMG